MQRIDSVQTEDSIRQEVFVLCLSNIFRHVIRDDAIIIDAADYYYKIPVLKLKLKRPGRGVTY